MQRKNILKTLLLASVASIGLASFAANAADTIKIGLPVPLTFTGNG